MYMGLWWPPAATEMRPGAPPKSRGYVCTGPGEVSSLVTDPCGTPMTPGNIWKKEYRRSFTILFRCYTRAHTHTVDMSGPFCFVLHLGCVKEMGKEIWAFSTVASAAPAIWFDCAQRSISLISLISLISDLESIGLMSLGRRHVGP